MYTVLLAFGVHRFITLIARTEVMVTSSEEFFSGDEYMTNEIAGNKMNFAFAFPIPFDLQDLFVNYVTVKAVLSTRDP